jgi:photosystem II stability/assembly factor-like uncharacterized protein
MAEEALRRNLEGAFDPGPNFPDRLLLSRTMARLEKELPYAGPKGRLSFGRIKPHASGRLVAALLIATVCVAASGAFLAIRQYAQHSVPAHSAHSSARSCSEGTLHLVSTSVAWIGTSQTTDLGNSWSEVGPPSLSNETGGGRTTCVLDSDHAWTTRSVGSSDTQVGQLFVFATSDGGRTWQRGAPVPIAGDAPGVQLQFLDSRRGWLLTTPSVNASVGNDAAIVYGTKDGGMHWSQLGASVPSGDPNSYLGQYLGCTGPTGLTFVDADHGWMAWDCIRLSFPFLTWTAPVIVTTDGGHTWGAPHFNDLAILPIPISATFTTHERWSCGADPPVFSDRSGVIPVSCAGYALTPDPGSNSWSTGGATGSVWSGILRTTDAGQTWSLGPLPVGVELSQMSFIDANTGYAFKHQGSGNDLYMTPDGGQSWIQINQGLFPGQSVVSFQFVSTAIGFAATGPASTSTFATLDGGRTWKRVS